MYNDIFSSSQLIHIDFPVFTYLGLMLSGHQSKLGSSLKIEKDYLIGLPVFDIFFRNCWQFWLKAAEIKELPLFRVKNWPVGTSWVLSLSHDVDHIELSSRFAPLLSWLVRLLDGQWPALIYLRDALIHLIGIYNIGWGASDYVRIENAFNVQSTFFLLKEVMKPKELAFFRRIARQGWGVELHASPSEQIDHNLLESGLSWIEEK